MGERLETVLLDVLELLLEAAYTRTKQPALRRANLRLEVARHLWRLAHELEISPAELRARWIYREGGTTPSGQVLRESVAAEEVLREATEAADYEGVLDVSRQTTFLLV